MTPVKHDMVCQMSDSRVKHKMNDKNPQSGNVLFLILIAIALFAALFYAVSSSTRPGGGDVGRETNSISLAQITQYPALVDTAVTSMVISGTDIRDVRFNTPAEFDDLTNKSNGVFHPDGGAATYVEAPGALMEDGDPGDWFFNANMEIPEIYISGIGGNDVIAFLPGIRGAICERINEEHGVGNTIPVLVSDLSASYRERMVELTADYVFPTTDQADIADSANTFDGQPFGCFQNAASGNFASEYVYYHVIVER